MGTGRTWGRRDAGWGPPGDPGPERRRERERAWGWRGSVWVGVPAAPAAELSTAGRLGAQQGAHPTSRRAAGGGAQHPPRFWHLLPGGASALEGVAARVAPSGAGVDTEHRPCEPAQSCPHVLPCVPRPGPHVPSLRGAVPAALALSDSGLSLGPVARLRAPHMSRLSFLMTTKCGVSGGVRPPASSTSGSSFLLSRKCPLCATPGRRPLNRVLPPFFLFACFPQPPYSRAQIPKSCHFFVTSASM